MQTNDNNTQQFEKQKNILDLEHQAHLNYFNVLATSGIATAFAITWSFFVEKISSELFATALIITIVLFSAAVLFILYKTEEIKAKIKVL